MFTVNPRNIAHLLMNEFGHLPPTAVNAREIELKETICGEYKITFFSKNLLNWKEVY